MLSGYDQLAAPGLIDRLIYGWSGTSPGILKSVGGSAEWAFSINAGIPSAAPWSDRCGW